MDTFNVIVEAWKECGQLTRTQGGWLISRVRELHNEAEHLRAEVGRVNTEDLFDRLLLWRGIDLDDACLVCNGAGWRAYGDTATWRGGIGGQMITGGVCDACWGSGSKSRPWPSWRARAAEATKENEQ